MENQLVTLALLFLGIGLTSLSGLMLVKTWRDAEKFAWQNDLRVWDSLAWLWIFGLSTLACIGLTLSAFLKLIN